MPEPITENYLVKIHTYASHRYGGIFLLGAGQLLHAHIGISEATHIPLGLLVTSIFSGIKNGLKGRNKELDETEENCDE